MSCRPLGPAAEESFGTGELSSRFTIAIQNALVRFATKLGRRKLLNQNPGLRIGDLRGAK